MTLLIIETSTERGAVGLVKAGKLIVERHLPFGLRSSSFLYENMEECFAFMQIGIEDLQGIAVGTGPGSFTGIRVGVAFAKGIAIARSLPLIGFSTLSAFISPYEGHFAALMEANRQGVYLLVQKRINEEVFPCGEDRYVPYDRVEEELKECLYWVTPSKSRLEKNLPNGRFLEQAPSLEHLAKKLSSRLDRGEYERNGKFPLSYLSTI